VIPAAVVDQILSAAVIEEVIGEYVDLKKSGSTYRGLSPFTSEKTPSFYVVPAKGIFKCFSSGKAGSLVTFLMEKEKISYPEALRLLARRYNIEVPEEAPSAEFQAERSERESLAAVLAWAAGWFADQLHSTDEGRSVALSYFRGRGFRDDIVASFGIGWCPERWDAMTTAALEAGYSLDRLVSAGLSKPRENGAFDFFRGRVMFPIRDTTGRVIAFGGRTLRKDKEVAKYFNSPESALYHKGDVLYGLDLARPAIVREDRVLLVEGYTDVMALHQAGVQHAVASSGTALTEGQIKLIRRFTRRVTVLYDGDAAGIRASLRGIDLLLAAGCDVQVVRFPDGEDPDSFSHKVGGEELRRFLDTESVDFLAFKVDLLGADAGSDPTRRAEMIHSVLDSLAAIPDPVRRSIYIQQCVAALGMQEEMLLLEVSRRIRDRSTTADKRARTAAPQPELPQEPVAVVPASRRAVIEEDLVRLLLLYGDRTVSAPVEDGDPVDVPFAEFAVHLLDSQGCTFQDSACAAIVEAYREAMDRGELPAAESWMRHTDSTVSSLVAHVATVRYEVSPNWTLRHGIYPEFEHDRLDKALHDSLHLMLLDEKERTAQALDAELTAAWERVEAGDAEAEQVWRDVLAIKMALDREVRTLAAYFGTAILR
jgi:DNA primase